MTSRACPACSKPIGSTVSVCPACGASDAGFVTTIAAMPGADSMRRGLAPGADPLIGCEVIGQFVIREKLGEGGMGAVYVADQPSVGRKAVIKVLLPEIVGSRALASRFGIEARAASRLAHPNIVTIYNHGEMGDGSLFLAMEHIQGASLAEVLRREGPFAVPRAAAIASQIASALAEAHRQGVVHRDVKPSNVMLVMRGSQPDFVKVLDFGIAKLEGTDLTRTGSLCGTPIYMSPEQFGSARIDGRSDLYSLGIVLYEMVTGRPPFTAETALGYMAKHLTEPVPPPPVPSPVASVILRALAKNPDDRWPSLDAFREELERSLEAPRPETEPRAPETSAERKPATSHALALDPPVNGPVTARKSAALAAASAALLARWLAAVAAIARKVYEATIGRALRPKPKTLRERGEALLETLRLRRRKTWSQRVRDRARAWIRRVR